MAIEKTVLEGSWLFDGIQVKPDKTCARIEGMIQQFKRLTSRDEGWTVLYVDSLSGDFWELSYPQSNLHGGGPPRLERRSADEVSARYPELGMHLENLD